MELRILLGCMLVAFITAPHMTNHLHLGGSRAYAAAHIVALVVVVTLALVGAPGGSVAWALFCGGGLLWRLRRGFAVSLKGVVSLVPFVFSAISAVWFIAADFDLKLLGYNRAWSLYAVLHGAVLGWLFVGCVAALAQRTHHHHWYTWGTLLSLLLFMCIAVGIHAAPLVKRTGVIGLTALVPALIARFVIDARGASRRWALLSLGAVVASMALAVMNEFWPLAFPREVLGAPTMVIVHGALNVVVTAPSFSVAVHGAMR